MGIDRDKMESLAEGNVEEAIPAAIDKHYSDASSLMRVLDDDLRSRKYGDAAATCFKIKQALDKLKKALPA
jgi:hypothetical protein